MHDALLTAEELAALRTPAQKVPMGSPRSGPVQIGNQETPHSSLIELHRSFAQALSSTLSELVDCEIKTRLGRLTTATYAHFVLGQSVPTCCAVVRSAAADLQFYVSIQSSILYPLIDRLLGCKESDPIPKRPITEIEAGLATILFKHVVDDYGKAWQKALSLDLQVDRLAFNAHQIGALPGSEETFAASYEIGMRQDFGHLDICLPWAATRQIRHRLAIGPAS